MYPNLFCVHIILYSIRMTLNENQIRCTLTPADLAARHLKLSELAYGTEKAKSLFRDMMQQASFDFGFEAENIPLMIEAIPSSSDSIVLIITKVEDPEELDTRFSKFTPAGDTESFNFDTLEKLQGADFSGGKGNSGSRLICGPLFLFRNSGRRDSGQPASRTGIHWRKHSVQGRRKQRIYPCSRTIRSLG